jgi:hypothetical protein
MLNAFVDFKLGLSLEILPHCRFRIIARPPGAVREHVGRHVFDECVENDAVTANTLDAALTQLNNLRAVFKGSKAVSDDEQGEFFAETFDGMHNGLFGFVIQRAGGFVKDDHISLLVKRAGDAYALAV